MKIKEIQSRKTEVITDIICDCCGKSCKVSEKIIDNPIRADHGESYYEFSFMKLHANWGFYSEKDLQSQTAHICEKCVDEKLLFIKFNNDKWYPHGR